jgi:DNA sulfur modification protein DndB
MKEHLSLLRNIDWKRNSNQWKLRVIRADGKIMTSNKAINLTANKIKQEIGIDLSSEEAMKEKQFLDSIKL